PGVHVVRLDGEVATRVDVPVPGGHGVVVAALRQPRGDPPGHLGAARHRQAAALAEVALHIHHDDRSSHPAIIAIPATRRRGSPQGTLLSTDYADSLPR